MSIVGHVYFKWSPCLWACASYMEEGQKYAD